MQTIKEIREDIKNNQEDLNKFPDDLASKSELSTCYFIMRQILDKLESISDNMAVYDFKREIEDSELSK